MRSPLLRTSPVDAPQARPLEALRGAVEKVIVGKSDVIELCLVALLAKGHLLLEDVPGVGKSTLAQALARAAGGTFRRVQFTSDLLPADLVGVNVFRTQTGTFEFREGPLFANFVLADEVNRAPPRTQSALLEAMGEHQVSVDGQSHALPDPFMVLATQNPEDHHGTYPLPESQRDRFLFRLELGYVPDELEARLLAHREPLRALLPADPVITPGDLLELQAQAEHVTLHNDLAVYAQILVRSTRHHPNIRLGVSTRGALAWARAARARAYLYGRSHVTLDDLQRLAPFALAHRIVLAHTHGEQNPRLALEFVHDLVAKTPVPI